MTLNIVHDELPSGLADRAGPAFQYRIANAGLAGTSALRGFDDDGRQRRAFSQLLDYLREVSVAYAGSPLCLGP